MSRMRLVATVIAAGLALSAGSALAASPYPPPSKGTGRVVPSHIKIGECAVFSGDGFAPLTPVAISDNGVSAGSAQSDASGTFSKKLCYSTDAKKGRHNLAGTGLGSQGDTLTVTAVLIVEGARQGANNPHTTPGGAATGPAGGANSGSAPGAVVTGPAQSVEGTGPDSLTPPAEPEQGAVAPVSDDHSGLRLIALGLTGLGFAFLASLILLLLARRRRRDEGRSDFPFDLTATA